MSTQEQRVDTLISSADLSAADAATVRGLYVISRDAFDDWLAQDATAAQKKSCAGNPAFAGRAGQIQPVYVNDEIDHYIAVTGDTTTPNAYQFLARDLPAGKYILSGHSADIDQDNLALGWALGGYRFDTFKSNTAKPATLVTPPGVNAAAHMADVIYRTRDIINLPTNRLGVQALAHRVETLAQKFNGAAQNHIVHNDADFPLVWHVGKAAQELPRIVDLTWGNGYPSNLNLTIIGKGVVYDTGGLSLKTRDGMVTMKKDMGGAAHAMALAELIMAENLPVNLRLIVPVVENAINERAFRNGDVIMSRGNKKSIEIINTDAEGRLILADALDLAGEGAVKPDLIIDFATLTAAARTVAEPGTAIIFCDDKKIARTLEDIGEEIDDRVQSIALDKRNAGKISSAVADLANSGTALPSHVFAAHFLNAFSPAGVTRVHVDQSAWDGNLAKDQALRTMHQYIRRRALGL